MFQYKTNRREALKASAALMGAGMAATVFGGLFQGCTTSSETALDWKPLFFTPEEAYTVGAFADHLLPATETPGAAEVGVSRFIDGLIQGCFGEDQKKAFNEGLKELNNACQEVNGKTFADCGADEKNKFFDAQEAQPMSGAQNLWGTDIVEGDKPTFYRQLKGLCLFGYFTSEKVGEEVLTYVPVPGKFEGCVPVESVGNISSI